MSVVAVTVIDTTRPLRPTAQSYLKVPLLDGHKFFCLFYALVFRQTGAIQSAQQTWALELHNVNSLGCFSHGNYCKSAGVEVQFSALGRHLADNTTA